jgi:endonuclease/exonuclease/phosphatase family metal-dependent hydrolase
MQTMTAGVDQLSWWREPPPMAPCSDPLKEDAARKNGDEDTDHNDQVGAPDILALHPLRLPRMITRQLTLMTYNIHSGVGVDRQYDLGRIGHVLKDERPHVAALQELECRSWRTAFDDQSGVLAADLGLTSSFCATRSAEEGSFGLAVLSAFPVLHHQQYDLSHATHGEPRSCLRVDVEVEPGAALHVFNCHLGLTVRERTFQRKQMMSDAILLSEELRHPVVVMGDFNDRPISVVHRTLRKHFRDAFSAAGKRWGPTFRFGPIPVRLDHIYVSGSIRVLDCWVLNNALTRVASDHRPVIASVEVTWP